MRDINDQFSINCHSSIRWQGQHIVLRFDPYLIGDMPHDAGLVFITHDHYDHFSPEDIRRVLAPDGFIVLPDTCYLKALEAGFDESVLLPVHTGVTYHGWASAFCRSPPTTRTRRSIRRRTAIWAMWSPWTAQQPMWPATPT